MQYNHRARIPFGHTWRVHPRGTLQSETIRQQARDCCVLCRGSLLQQTLPRHRLCGLLAQRALGHGPVWMTSHQNIQPHVSINVQRQLATCSRGHWRKALPSSRPGGGGVGGTDGAPHECPPESNANTKYEWGRVVTGRIGSIHAFQHQHRRRQQEELVW